MISFQFLCCAIVFNASTNLALEASAALAHAHQLLRCPNAFVRLFAAHFNLRITITGGAVQPRTGNLRLKVLYWATQQNVAQEREGS